MTHVDRISKEMSYEFNIPMSRVYFYINMAHQIGVEKSRNFMITNGNEDKYFNSQREIAEYLNVSQNTISRRIEDKYKCYGYKIIKLR